MMISSLMEIRHANRYGVQSDYLERLKRFKRSAKVELKWWHMNCCLDSVKTPETTCVGGLTLMTNVDGIAWIFSSKTTLIGS